MLDFLNTVSLPWAWIIGPEENRDIVTSQAGVYNVTYGRVNCVGDVATRASDNLKGVLYRRSLVFVVRRREFSYAVEMERML